MPPQDRPPATGPVSPAAALRQMLIGYRISQAIYVAAKLGIADLLKDGAKSSDELAKSAGANADALHRLLRVLASLGVFAQVDQRRFTLTPLGELLRTDVPGSLWGYAVTTGEWRWRAYGDFLHSVKTGQSAHDHVYGMGIWEYFHRHPETGQMYDTGNVAFRMQWAVAVAAAYDFSGVHTVIDVGGGTGDLVAVILKANPAMRGVVFELPYAIEDARALVEAEGLAGRCEVVAGDAFESVPSGGDAYILMGVIHGFNDERAGVILKNCRRVMPGQGKLLLVEGVMPERADQASQVVLGDLEMLVMAGGRERTEEEFRSLLGSAGFKLTKVVPTQSVRRIIEGAPV